MLADGPRSRSGRKEERSKILLTSLAVVAVSGDPRRATCDDPTLERWDKEIPTNDAQAGNSYCIKTDRGGWAWIDVIEFANETEDGQRFVTVIDITYWDE